MMKHASLLAATLAGGVMAVSTVVNAAGHSKSLVDTIKDKGFVQCGVSTGLAGFSTPDDKGNWTGLDVDVCRAVAAAIFGDSSRVQFTPLTAKERFTALQSGEIDMLSRNTTWTLTRDSNLGLNFAGVNYYDGQGFMVYKSLGVTSAKELDGASVCIQAGTTTELNLADYFRANDMSYEAITYSTSDQTIEGFKTGRCDVLTSDQSQLYALRLKLDNPKDAMVLPEIISKEPLGPVVRNGAEDMLKIVRWSLFAMVNAEEMGVTSKNVDYIRATTKDPGQQRLLGKSGIGGKGLGVSDNWAYDIIKQVGNYGESFERNVGSGSPLQIARGVNALWNQGGIQYAPPIR